ncbi:hypothetical protein [Okeania sp. KiyG1]|uniref:hypothetical protein n=1 Tax=Okeania sp. KiyG1 TaxID=2720165 RepID=UPI00192322B5|nr:hypothetical protein [Okeania sp. KiyG1]GGA56077.1 hypothetical protein CYANOKiyG1_76870 [Okeania sp. KiyG1]
MTILKQTLRLEHKLDDGDVLSSEIEFDFDGYDNYDETLNEARQFLVDIISNGRPGIIDKCRHAMGMRYSQAEFNKDWLHYQQLCLNIDKNKLKIATKRKNLKFLLDADNRLTALEQMMKTAGFYQEFCDLLEASTKVQGGEDLKEEKEQLSHLKLPMVCPSEGEAEDESDQRKADTD